jgi:hypothetical protein
MTLSILGIMNREQSFTVGNPQKPNDLYQLLYHFIDSVIDGFTYNGLSDAEDDITLAMSYYLDSKSEESSDIFKFINQAKKADIGVYIGRHYDSKNIKKLCWIEAKRLPTPDCKCRDEHEYVFVDHSQIKFRGNGGIERFKLNKHGEGFPVAIMFGYIQSNSFEYWEEKVNQWLQTFSSFVPSYYDELLVRISSKANRFCSTHLRIDHKSKQKMNDIVIYHFWLTLVGG